MAGDIYSLFDCASVFQHGSHSDTNDNSTKNSRPPSGHRWGQRLCHRCQAARFVWVMSKMFPMYFDWLAVLQKMQRKMPTIPDMSSYHWNSNPSNRWEYYSSRANINYGPNSPVCVWKRNMCDLSHSQCMEIFNGVSPTFHMFPSPACVVFSDRQTFLLLLLWLVSAIDGGVCRITYSLNITDDRRRADDGGLKYSPDPFELCHFEFIGNLVWILILL